MFGRKKPQFQMTLDQCLPAVVVRNPQVQEKDLPDGRIELDPAIPQALADPGLLPQGAKDLPSPLRTGRDRCRPRALIDGKRTVADLVEHLARTRSLDPQQAQESMVSYVQMLMVRGLVGLVVQQQA